MATKKSQRTEAGWKEMQEMLKAVTQEREDALAELGMVRAEIDALKHDYENLQITCEDFKADIPELNTRINDLKDLIVTIVNQM